MNKSELAAELAEQECIHYTEAFACVSAIFDTMTEALLKGDRIELRGFGSFVVKDYKSYKGRNPKTGESIIVKEKKLPTFKAGVEMRKRVDYV